MFHYALVTRIDAVSILFFFSDRPYYFSIDLVLHNI